jgi:predicted nucleotidyltransferase
LKKFDFLNILIFKKDKIMRLTSHQSQSIKETFDRYFHEQDKIWLFGSRVDDSKKGGDIDLYIETNYDDPAIALKQKIIFLRELKKKIGDQKIDVIINNLKSHHNLPIYDEARKTGIELT